jgi:hypothetical protein
MADSSYLSDTNKSAVAELISQAQDLCDLEQVSAINCSSFTDSSVLPANLHSSFHKLNSFQLIKPKPLGPPPYTNTNCSNFDKADAQAGNGNEEDAAVFSHFNQDPYEKMGFQPRSIFSQKKKKKLHLIKTSKMMKIIDNKNKPQSRKSRTNSVVGNRESDYH